MAKKREYTTQKIDLELIKILDRIILQEEKRKGECGGYREATAILAKRINDAGGVKEH